MPSPDPSWSPSLWSACRGPSRPGAHGLAAGLRVAVALGLASSLAGCGTPVAAPPPASPAVVTPPEPEKIVYVFNQAPVDKAARHLLAYQETLSRLPTADLSRELGRLGDGGGSWQSMMDLALVLGTTRANGDLARAQALLDQVLTSNAPEAQAWHGLARLLAARFADQRRAEDQIERLNQQVRDLQRDNQRKVDQLNEKLEALKSIERSLNSRGIPVPASVAAPPSSSSAKTTAAPTSKKP